MEKCTMFMDWKNQQSENEYTTQSNLQMQCNPYQATNSIPPGPFFFLKIALAIRGFLYFHTNWEIICSSSLKNTIGSLIGIALNLQIALGSIFIFTILILPIHEHGMFLDLFVYSLISFNSVLQFSIYRSFVSLGRYIPKIYFILSVAMVNGMFP